MNLSELAAHTATVTAAAAVGAVLRYCSDGLLRFIAGITAILARDTRPRSERALDVLRALGRGRQTPPRPPSGKSS